MKGRIFSTAPDEKNGVSARRKRQVVRAVDLADAERRLAFGARNTHLTLVVHAVGRVRLVLVREDLSVAGALSDGVETGDVPESAVLLVPRDRTPARGGRR